MAGENLIHSNGVYVGYDNVPYARREDKAQTFQIWYDKPEVIGSLREQSINAAKAVRELTDKEIVVLYSGGMDSEWVIESFVSAGIEVTPLIIEYAGGLNSHDINWAKRYLSRRNITNVIHEVLDLREWYASSQIKEIAYQTQTIELAYTTQFQSLIRNNNGSRFFITGYDEPGMAADDSGAERQWKLFYNERHYSVVKLFAEYGIPGAPNWGRFDSKLFASYVCQPQWQMLAANMYSPQIWNSELVKVPMFQAAFPFMEARPKYTGFETALDAVVDGSRAWHAELNERLGYKWDQEWSRNIKDVWADLGMGSTSC